MEKTSMAELLLLFLTLWKKLYGSETICLKMLLWSVMHLLGLFYSNAAQLAKTPLILSRVYLVLDIVPGLVPFLGQEKTSPLREPRTMSGILTIIGV